jgi:hypothetical protein
MAKSRSDIEQKNFPGTSAVPAPSLHSTRRRWKRHSQVLPVYEWYSRRIGLPNARNAPGERAREEIGLRPENVGSSRPTVCLGGQSPSLHNHGEQRLSITRTLPLPPRLVVRREFTSRQSACSKQRVKSVRSVQLTGGSHPSRFGTEGLRTESVSAKRRSAPGLRHRLRAGLH